MPEYWLRVFPSAVSLPWESQVVQYPERGEPGISYFAGERDKDTAEPYDVPIDCLLWRDEDGLVRGIVNHYPIDYPPFEVAGNVNVFVDPAWRRRGVGRDLVREAHRRWPINWTQQRYTLEGVELAQALIPELEGSDWQKEQLE